jgi:integrase
LDYGIHDLRRTWITRTLDTQPPHEVMRAADHADLRTTMRYLRDKNQLSDKKFVPKTGQKNHLRKVD